MKSVPPDRLSTLEPLESEKHHLQREKVNVTLSPCSIRGPTRMTEEESTPLPVIGQNKDPSPGEGRSEQLHPKALPGQPHVESSLAPKRKERGQGGFVQALQ